MGDHHRYRSHLYLRVTLPILVSALAPAAAQTPPDLAQYDCTRTDDGATVAGDKLAGQGFRLASQARFGSVNLMLVDPKTSVRANCFRRTPP